MSKEIVVVSGGWNFIGGEIHIPKEAAPFRIKCVV